MFRLSVIGVFERRSDHIRDLSHSHSLAHTRSPSSHLFRIRLCHVSLFSLNICICSQLKTHILIAVILAVFIHASHTQAHSISLARLLCLFLHLFCGLLDLVHSMFTSFLCLPVCLSVGRSVCLLNATLSRGFHFSIVHTCTVNTIRPYSLFYNSIRTSSNLKQPNMLL